MPVGGGGGGTALHPHAVNPTTMHYSRAFVLFLRTGVSNLILHHIYSSIAEANNQ